MTVAEREGTVSSGPTIAYIRSLPYHWLLERDAWAGISERIGMSFEPYEEVVLVPVDAALLADELEQLEVPTSTIDIVVLRRRGDSGEGRYPVHLRSSPNQLALALDYIVRSIRTMAARGGDVTIRL